MLLIRFALSAHRVRQYAGFIIVIFLIFAHARISAKRYRACARYLGRVGPIGIHQYRSIVLHIADQHGCADFYLGGVGLGVLNRKMQAVLLRPGGCHQAFSRYVDRSVRCLLTLRICGCNDDVLPDGDIGVVFVGKDSYAGAEAKSGSFLFIIAAIIGAFQLVFDILDAAFAICTCGVFGLFIIDGIHRSIFDCLCGIDGLSFALNLVFRFL